MATPDWIRKELQTNLARASRAGRRAAKTEPRAARAAYLPQEEALRVELTNGVSITIPIELIPDLEDAAPTAICAVEVLGRGGGLHWECLDLDLGVPALISSIFAGREWMAELGRAGGRRSSAAKATAARRNGRKGGRPRMASGRITKTANEMVEKLDPGSNTSSRRAARRSLQKVEW
jgi:hypothetical protein